MKRTISLVCALALVMAILAGCGSSSAAPAETEAPAAATQAAAAPEPTEEPAPAQTEEPEAEEEAIVWEEAPIPDGVYLAKFDTDSGMFHVNESCDGMGTLTVKDGKMTIHVSLAGKGIVNLFVGSAADAKKEGADLLEPTTDSVTYSDGYTENVYGFDIPVPYLDREFPCALIGSKGTWYDHMVSVSDPVAEN